MELWRSNEPQAYLKRILDEGSTRDCGRAKEDFATVEFENGVIECAEGSANLRLGTTTVMCGVKVKVGPPTSERPDEGILVPNVELPPLCSRKFKLGPPSEEAQRLNFAIHDLLINSQCVDLKKLCIEEGRLVYIIHVDLVCLNYDGSIFDTCLLAMAAALKNTKVPRVQFLKEQDEVQRCKEVFDLPVRPFPLSITYALFDRTHIVCQPTQQEEDVSEGQVVVSILEGKVAGVRKTGLPSLSTSTLRELCDRAIDRVAVLQSQLNSS